MKNAITSCLKLVSSSFLFIQSIQLHSLTSGARKGCEIFEQPEYLLNVSFIFPIRTLSRVMIPFQLFALYILYGIDSGRMKLRLTDWTGWEKWVIPELQ